MMSGVAWGAHSSHIQFRWGKGRRSGGFVDERERERKRGREREAVREKEREREREKWKGERT